ncbi:MAG: acyltransferase family protein, partial [Candidatus Hodarchaeota archaeon]
MTVEALPTSRLDWIEVAKGVGITFVILVHSMIPLLNPVTIHLSSFTIPLFFVLAGLTYNNERHRGNIRSFAASRGKQFLIPYFFLYAIMMILFVPLAPSIETSLTPIEIVLWFIYGNGPPKSASHLWFLPVLYFGLMVFVVMDRAMQRFPSYSRWIFLVIFPLMASAIQSLFAPTLVPWRISSVFLSATFVLVGNIMRGVRGLNPWLLSSRTANLILFVVLSALLVLVSQLNGFTDIAVDNYGVSAFIYMIPGVTGTVLVFAASSAIAYSSPVRRFFMAIGKNSQELYEIHPVAFYLAALIALPLGLPLAG